MIFRRLYLAVLLALSGFAIAGDGDTPKDQPARFRITTKRKGDSVRLRQVGAQGQFIIKSPFGISKAVIERATDKWPEAVALRLHLKGLEGFRASNSEVTLEAAVSIQDRKLIARVWKGGKEDHPLDEKSLYWMGIRRVGRAGKPDQESPLKQGYFEVMLPKMFFEGNPRSITLSWIDFYRN
jgi:hypothetical protein